MPITERTDFKLLLLTFKSLNDVAPPYIEELFVRYRPTKTLRSADEGLLVQTKYNLKAYGFRAFSQAAPKIWNSMPVSLRICCELSAFKSKLFFLSVLFSCNFILFYLFIFFEQISHCNILLGLLLLVLIVKLVGSLRERRYINVYYYYYYYYYYHYYYYYNFQHLQSWTKVLTPFCISEAFSKSHSSNPSTYPKTMSDPCTANFFAKQFHRLKPYRAHSPKLELIAAEVGQHDVSNIAHSTRSQNHSALPIFAKN